MGDQAALHDGPSTVQQGAELRLREEPPQHLLPGPGAEPPAPTTQQRSLHVIKDSPHIRSHRPHRRLNILYPTGQTEDNHYKCNICVTKDDCFLLAFIFCIYYRFSLNPTVIMMPVYVALNRSGPRGDLEHKHRYQSRVKLAGP